MKNKQLLFLHTLIIVLNIGISCAQKNNTPVKLKPIAADCKNAIKISTKYGPTVAPE